METSVNLADYILGLVTNSALVMLLSGWIAVQITKATGLGMILQTWLVAIIVTFFASVFGVIPVNIAEFWSFLRFGVFNGVMANLLYKIGAYDALLVWLKAKTAHQSAQ